jgi:GTP pyrophosphokinase
VNLQIEDKATRNTSPSRELYELDLNYYRSRLAKYIDVDREDREVFFKALDFAYNLHAGQTRKSGMPYISHPCAVAEILARELKLQDPIILAAAVLHDVVEDIPSIGIEDIENQFGGVVAELVDGCTKLTRYYMDRSTLKDLTHSKIFLSASRRLGVLIIKLADRLHNLRTLHFLPSAKRQRIAQETIEVYAPIAAKLSIFQLKRELYHLALSYLYPRKSKKILHLTQGLLSSPETAQCEQSLYDALSSAPFSAVIRPRLKGLGSYYNSLKRTLDLANAENHVDFTIILGSEDVLSCYNVLGIVNSTFPPIPRSIRDFIAIPKNTTYRSLHVRVHVGGRNYLVKIRTPDMDGSATYGVLYRWDLREPISDEHWQELSELLRNIGEYGGAAPQRKALIRLSETEEIFVHTPKGDIIYFPKGSVVLDFAYKIHSDLGDYCIGAEVNGQWEPPTYKLKDGDMIEILTSEEPLDVDPDLEILCRTPKARTAINRRLQQKRLHYAQDIGRQILFQEFQKHGIRSDVLEEENTRLILEIIGAAGLQDLFVKIGQDLLSPHLVLYYLTSSSLPRKEHGQKHASTALMPSHVRNKLLVPELDKAIHKFARCCNPFPGQEHVVATLSERGITFHHENCKDLLERHDLPPQKLLNVEWDLENQWRHPLVFELQVFNETPVSLFPSFARLPSTIRIQNLSHVMEKGSQSFTRVGILLESFQEAHAFFTCLPSYHVVIEDYGQGECASGMFIRE